MFEFEQWLMTKAAKELWHDVADDKQITSKPAMITPLRGNKQVIDSRITSITLPDATKRYTVYEIGQSAPRLLGISEILMRWVRLDELSARENMIVHIHTKQRMIPLSSAYILRDNHKNILLAIDSTINHDLLYLRKNVYLHIYSSNWLDLYGGLLVNPIQHLGGQVIAINDIIPVLDARQNLAEGNGLMFHNGYYVDGITSSEVNVGDTLTYQIDKTGRGFVDFPVSELKHFTSILDGMEKVLIQLPSVEGESELNCEPGDELEVFVCATQINSSNPLRVKGFFYSRITRSDQRMVTHRDFAINALRLETLISEHSADMDTTDVFLRVFVRQHTNGLHEFQDNQYLQDLFRVDMQSREALMVGAAGTYQGWHPDVLEASPAITWQEEKTEHLTLERLKGVYSFPALNQFAVEPRLVDNVATMPPVMELGGKVLCFNGEDVLFSIIDYNHVIHFGSITVPLGTYKVQCIPGTFSENGLGFDRDTDFIDQASYWNEKFYYMTLEDGTWVEAQEGIDYHIDTETGVLTWGDIHAQDGRMRRTIEDAIYRHFDIEPEMLHVPLDIYADGGPVTLLRLGRLDVYINGRYAIEDIDYVVDYPRITITNKQYYLTSDIGDMVSIDIFHYGVPGDVDREDVFGFVRNRKLRDTDPHVFTELRNVHCVADGALVDVNDLGVFESQDRDTVSEIREGALYGFIQRPWMIGPWARKRLLADDAYTAMIEASGAVSKLIDDTASNNPVFIPYGHAIYSPFIKRTILRIREGDIDVYSLGVDATAVALAMEPYLDELDTDILNSDKIDWDMVDVHPTPNIFQVGITEEELLFLRMVNQLYCHGRLTFNTYTNVVNPDNL